MFFTIPFLLATIHHLKERWHRARVLLCLKLDAIIFLCRFISRGRAAAVSNSIGEKDVTVHNSEKPIANGGPAFPELNPSPSGPILVVKP